MVTFDLHCQIKDQHVHSFLPLSLVLWVFQFRLLTYFQGIFFILEKDFFILAKALNCAIEFLFLLKWVSCFFVLIFIEGVDYAESFADLFQNFLGLSDWILIKLGLVDQVL